MGVATEEFYQQPGTQAATEQAFPGGQRRYPGFSGLSPDFTADDYLAWLSARPRSIAALALGISLPAWGSGEPLRYYLNLLQSELDLLAKCHGRERPVAHLQWGSADPLPLAGAELTELMHVIASRFRLVNRPERVYRVHLHPAQTQAERLALLKGLGFNHLTLHCHGVEPNLAEALAASAAFGFHHVQAMVCDTQPAWREALMHTIAVGVPRIEWSGNIAEVQVLLAARGYRHLAAGVFVLPEDPLLAARDQGRLKLSQAGLCIGPCPELIGAGIGALSELGDCQTRNFDGLSDYAKALKAQRLPIAAGRVMDTTDRGRMALLRAQVMGDHPSGPAWRPCH